MHAQPPPSLARRGVPGARPASCGRSADPIRHLRSLTQFNDRFLIDNFDVNH
jgi:hypothetical protein